MDRDIDVEQRERQGAAARVVQGAVQRGDAHGQSLGPNTAAAAAAAAALGGGGVVAPQDAHEVVEAQLRARQRLRALLRRARSAHAAAQDLARQLRTRRARPRVSHSARAPHRLRVRSVRARTLPAKPRSTSPPSLSIRRTIARVMSPCAPAQRHGESRAATCGARGCRGRARSTACARTMHRWPLASASSASKRRARAASSATRRPPSTAARKWR
eukprot:scaffold583_cov323-Prasinococcus_capsulatus_cf.AAC.1